MFLTSDYYRIQAPEDGGDAINLSGITNDTPPAAATSAAAATDAAATQAAADAKAAADAAAASSTTAFVEINDETDKNIRDVLSTTYEDLTTVKFNTNGDVVNTEGKVLIAKDALATSVSDLKAERVTKADEYIKGLGTIAIAGEDGKEVDHTIEEDGSIKDAEGNVLYTAEQLRDQIMQTDDYLEDAPEYESIYEEANVLTGLEFNDANGVPIDFEETPEGLAQRDLHIARTEGGRIANEQISQFFNDNPDLNDAYFYLKARGTLDGFGTRTNHEGITVATDNAQQHIDLIVEAEVMRGLPKEAAARRAKVFADNDMAFEESKAALAYMQNQEQLEKQADVDKTNADKAAAAKSQQEYWEGVTNIINSGKVMDYNIPENIRVPMPNGTIVHKTREDFYNYLSQPVANGLTADQIAAQKEPLDTKIFNALLRFVNNDASYIVSQKVKQTQVGDFKKRFTKGGIPSNRVVIRPPAKKSNNDNIQI